MTEPLRAACIQMTSGPDIAENLKTAEMYIRQAAKSGAKFIATPENTDQIRQPPSEKLKTAPEPSKHPGIVQFAALAKELNIHLLAGSFAVQAGGGRLYNRSLLFSPNGRIAGQYDKIHLFDIDLPNGESYRESDVIAPGDKTVIADTPFGKIGMTICYDVRFAYLYRKLAQSGASILTIPSAFTVPTGKAHWETLVRARAIETGSFIIAPGQTGEHENGRKTWGHSLIVGPWGEILADGGTEPGIVMADLNLDDVKKVRALIPALRHDRKI
jgi:predicted amidohydrolase